MPQRDHRSAVRPGLHRRLCRVLASSIVARANAPRRDGVRGGGQRTCSVSSPTQRDVLYDGTMAGFSLVPRCPMIGSRLQKMSAVCSFSFFSIPVLMSSLSTMTPADATRPGTRGDDVRSQQGNRSAGSAEEK